MARKQTFEEAARKLNLRYPHLILIEYGSSATDKATFLDEEYGIFSWPRYDKVYSGEGKHPKRSLINITQANQNPEKIQKTKISNMKKWGASHPMQISEIKEKQQYSVFKRFGVKNPSQSIICQQKKKRTNLQRFGVEEPLACSEVRDKKDLTCILLYGSVSPMKNLQISNKMIQTKIKKQLINPDISYESRNSRNSRFFRKEVLKRDKYECKKCFSKENLEVHHILSFLFYKELRFEVNNGITLCRSCHDIFHNIFGLIIKEDKKDKIWHFIQKDFKK